MSAVPRIADSNRTSPQVSNGHEHYGERAKPIRLRFHVGTAISQRSPSDRQSKSTLPPSALIVPSMRRLPKPLRSGALTLGPPNSIQRSTSCPFSLRDHVNPIWPSALDSAPYLEALVANSCKTTAIACALVGSNT